MASKESHDARADRRDAEGFIVGVNREEEYQLREGQFTVASVVFGQDEGESRREWAHRTFAADLSRPVVLLGEQRVDEDTIEDLLDTYRAEAANRIGEDLSSRIRIARTYDLFGAMKAFASRGEDTSGFHMSPPDALGKRIGPLRIVTKSHSGFDVTEFMRLPSKNPRGVLQSDTTASIRSVGAGVNLEYGAILPILATNTSSFLTDEK